MIIQLLHEAEELAAKEKELHDKAIRDQQWYDDFQRAKAERIQKTRQVLLFMEDSLKLNHQPVH